MDSTIISRTDPTNLLTFLLGQPETSSFDDGYTKEPTWFSTSLPFFVSAKSPTTRCLTFERVKHLVKSLASGLRKEGFLPGDRLILISPENIYMSVMLLATIAAGGIFVGRRPDYTAAQQAIIFKHCEPSFILAYKGSEDIAVEADRIAKSNARLFSYDDDFFDAPTPLTNLTDGLVSWGKLLDEEGAASFQWPTFKTMADSETTALIVYTTGTTSDPKGVELTHRSLLTASSYHQYLPLHPSQQGVWFHNYSTAFLGASAIFLMALKSRNRLIVYDFPSFNPDSFLHFINFHKCNMVFSTKQAIDAIPAHKSQNDLSHVSAVITGGAVIPQFTRQAVNHFLGKPIFKVTYGFTEAGGFVSMEDEGSMAGPSSCVEKLLPHIQSRIVDDDGKPVTEGQPGNLHWRTPSVMKGYWRNAEATQAALSKDGWIDSGDIGFLDSDGQLHITGRAKETLKIRGRPVNPSGIEETLIEMSGISVACVVGIQDQQGEDLPRAYIVRDQHVAEPVDVESVHAFMGEKMSDDHQLTGGVEFVDGDWLPYGGNGKVLRKEVQKRAQGWYDAELKAIRQGANTVEGANDSATADRHTKDAEAGEVLPSAAQNRVTTDSGQGSAETAQPTTGPPERSNDDLTTATQPAHTRVPQDVIVAARQGNLGAIAAPGQRKEGLRRWQDAWMDLVAEERGDA